MRAGAVRGLAKRPADELEKAISALIEGEELPFEVDGEDDGERLTHVNLALRVRRRVDSGEEPKVAFRAVMAGVRAVLTNEP